MMSGILSSYVNPDNPFSCCSRNLNMCDADSIHSIHVTQRTRGRTYNDEHFEDVISSYKDRRFPALSGSPESIELQDDELNFR